VYIDTPLRWGIYASAHDSITSLEDDREYRYAISRLGSGSHLMPLIHAEQRCVRISPDHLVVVNSLHGGVDSLVNGDSDLFYWEENMTRPFEKLGKVKEIGSFEAPWSSFLIVASNRAIREKENALRTVLDLMIKEFVESPQSLHHLTHRFDLTQNEAQQWLKSTKWNDNYTAQLELLVNARNALTRVHACDKSLRVEQLCAPWIELT
jgi:sulfonate transport system substrate-binding protein